MLRESSFRFYGLALLLEILISMIKVFAAGWSSWPVGLDRCPIKFFNPSSNPVLTSHSRKPQQKFSSFIGFQDSPLFAGFIDEEGEAGLAYITHNKSSNAGVVAITERQIANISIRVS